MNGDDVIAQAVDSEVPDPPTVLPTAPAYALGSETSAGTGDSSASGVSEGDTNSSHDDAPDVEFADEDTSASDETEPDPAEVRQRLVTQFEAWLDRMAEGEPPPEGIPEEILADALEAPDESDPLGSDLYTLFAALTKLSGEIGLQGRSFKQLADVLAPSMQVPGRLDRIEAAQVAVARELARRSEPDKTDMPAAEDVLAVLFDLYDRLHRGLENFDAGHDAGRSRVTSGGFLHRLFGGKQQSDQVAAPSAAIREGYHLTLSRLEAAMLQWGIQRIGKVGETFDPERMAVVEVASVPGAPDGSVLEVYRSGYVLNGRVLSTARVKVAKASAS